MFRTTLLFFIWAYASGLQAQEICDNGVDDDTDGLIDLNDTTDCACGLTAVPLDGILPNPSFEDHDCIPTSFSQVDCLMSWAQATGSTSDYFRTDGYMPAFIPQPLPGGGNGCIGGYFCHDYMEYVGGCLWSPLLAGQAYDLTMSVAAFEVDNFLNQTTVMDLSPVDMTIYGLATCPSFPTNVILCPGDEGWTELGHVTWTPSGVWSTITITMAPTFDVQSIMLGSPCTLPDDYPNVFDDWLAYFLMDELSMSTSGTVGAEITGEGNWCDGDLVATAHPDSSITGYQWYQNGVAIPGATDTILSISALSLDSGEYVFRAVSDTSCAISTFHVGTEIEPTPYIALTVDGLWCPLEGTYQWYLDGSVIPEATGAYLVPESNGVYTVELTNAQGCSTLSFPFDWIGMASPSLTASGPTLLFSPADATLRLAGFSERSLLTVRDAAGRMILSEWVTGPDHRCSLTDAAHGIYAARAAGQTLRFVR